jgi:ParB family chromosome partitioning protein
MTARDTPARLGRGLAALLGEAAGSPARAASASEAAIAGPAAGVRDLPVDLLDPGPFQPRRRMDPAALDELTDSVRRQGILQPLLVRPHPSQPARYQIIAGERRWRAAQQAALATVPVLLRALDDRDATAAALVENLQRQDLDAVEEAEGYRRLLDEFAMTQDALAQSVGKSRSHVANTLRLLNLPATVLGEVRNGALSPGHARALLAHPAPEKAALAVIAGQLSVRQTEALVQRATAPPRPPKARDPDAEAVARDLSSRLGLNVEVTMGPRGGHVRILWRSFDQLDGVIRLLRGGSDQTDEV